MTIDPRKIRRLTVTIYTEEPEDAADAELIWTFESVAEMTVLTHFDPAQVEITIRGYRPTVAWVSSREELTITDDGVAPRTAQYPELPEW